WDEQDDSADGFQDSWDGDDFNKDPEYEEGGVVYQVNSKPEQIPQKFPKGCKVIHSLYGEGTVLESEGAGPEEKVVIKFLDGARKKFMVRFAPLVLTQ
ncbi:MAG: hypothetical protein NXH75_06865, partial [Halobacteriovoraceae bacterium]|nr:hypothetical protein [Halobacteriovoraceae bacterium]